MPAKPFLHPRTGIYYFRRVVPLDMRDVVGKVEIKISLATRDIEQARREHKRVAAQVDRDWGRLVATASPATQQVLHRATPRDLASLAGELYADIVAANEDDPGDAIRWRRALMEIQQALVEKEREPNVKQQWPGNWSFMPKQVAIRLVGGDVDALLVRKGIALSMAQRHALCLKGASAIAQAYRHLERLASGEYAPDAAASRFPPPLDVTDWRPVYEAYCLEALPDPSTRKRQEGVLRHFFDFLGHDRLASVKEIDAIRWKEKRLAEVARDTVRKADLAHPRAFFAWCALNSKISSDPFFKVKLPTRRKKVLDENGEVVPGRRMREYSPEEARAVLQASLVPMGSRASAEGAAARRWIPWLCAYSGARVNEITQLRHEDVRLSRSRDGKRMIWVISIHPEAGSVKTDDAREVALHPHLIEQGFLEFVETRKDRCLFYDPKRRRNGSSANPQYAKVGERLARWIRKDLRITDDTVAPNHAWRHLFRSEMLAAGVQEQVINGIDGHAPSSEGQKYGKVWPEVSLDAVSRIPAYTFEVDTSDAKPDADILR